MQTLLRPTLRSAALASLFALAACGGSGDNNLAALDNELLANGADPALTSALEDQILVDPNLVQQAHPNAVRPPESPVQAQYPAGSAAEGARRAVPARATTPAFRLSRANRRPAVRALTMARNGSAAFPPNSRSTPARA
jgi:hypothetical protein